MTKIRRLRVKRTWCRTHSRLRKRTALIMRNGIYDIPGTQMSKQSSSPIKSNPRIKAPSEMKSKLVPRITEWQPVPQNNILQLWSSPGRKYRSDLNQAGAELHWDQVALRYIRPDNSMSCCLVPHKISVRTDCLTSPRDIRPGCYVRSDHDSICDRICQICRDGKRLRCSVGIIEKCQFST